MMSHDERCTCMGCSIANSAKHRNCECWICQYRAYRRYEAHESELFDESDIGKWNNIDQFYPYEDPESIFGSGGVWDIEDDNPVPF